jgi:hypothetical protein
MLKGDETPLNKQITKLTSLPDDFCVSQRRFQGHSILKFDEKSKDLYLLTCSLFMMLSATI